jgi:hypothetical protein
MGIAQIDTSLKNFIESDRALPSLEVSRTATAQIDTSQKLNV